MTKSKSDMTLVNVKNSNNWIEFLEFRMIELLEFRTILSI